ncbi:MAG: hypothetical protein RMN51_08295 [Verrucomicrobiota bacterium]|nr:hypothetical protein [Verrucomicrobiota bacterium]
MPQATGNYVFFIAADDDADLYLGTNASPASKRLIAQQEGWAGRNNWVSHGGGPFASTQRRSDLWTPDGGVTQPYAGGIPLEVGQRDWIEAAHRERSKDNVAVTYKLLTEPDPMDGDAPRLVGALIGYMAEPAAVERPVLVVSQQGNKIVISWSPAGVSWRAVRCWGPGPGGSLRRRRIRRSYRSVAVRSTSGWCGR